MYKYNDINLYDHGKKIDNITFSYHRGDLNWSDIYVRNFKFQIGLRYEYFKFKSVLYNSDYMAQLATFTQVEATKEMNDNTLQDMASNLVGKQVIMTTTQNSNGYIGGTVDYWETINGTVYLGIGGKLYDIADLDTVMDKDYFDKWKGNGSTTDTKTEDTKPGE